MNILKFIIIAAAIIPLYPQVANVEKSNSYYSRAMDYYEQKNYDSLIYYMNKALKLRPNHPRILYNLAAGYALNGNKPEALKILDKIAGMKLQYPIQDDSDFASLKNSAAFNKILEKFKDNMLEISNSESAFRLPEKGLLTEGIAFDEATGKFFISSVHKRKIAERDADGTARKFNSDADTLLGIFGQRADSKHRKLWAAGSAIKFMKDYNDHLKGMSILYEFDLDSGRLLNTYDPPGKEKEHLFGDLTIDSKGNVFVSDSKTNEIYKLSAGEKKLETFIPSGNFVSLQGLDFNDDDSLLFAADYSQGIFKLNRNTRSVVPIRNKSGTTLLGIDGLYFYGGNLIAIQNGVNPQRIILLELNSDNTSIYNYKILESNNPLFDEPTLGVIAGNSFYYIANSQWSRFNKNGTIFPDEELEYPLIMQLDLD